METSERQFMFDDRLAPFIRNDPALDGEQGGMLHQSRHFPGVDFLVPTSKLHESLTEFSAQIQEAVNLYENR